MAMHRGQGMRCNCIVLLRHRGCRLHQTCGSFPPRFCTPGRSHLRARGGSRVGRCGHGTGPQLACTPPHERNRMECVTATRPAASGALRGVRNYIPQTPLPAALRPLTGHQHQNSSRQQHAAGGPLPKLLATHRSLAGFARHRRELQPTCGGGGDVGLVLARRAPLTKTWRCGALLRLRLRLRKP
jgi:hypothetical protein